MPKRERKRWATSFGRYGCRVRVYEEPNGTLYAEERVNGQSVRHSLGHRNKSQAKDWARGRVRVLEQELAQPDTPPDIVPTVTRVTDAFRELRSPHKRTEQGRRNDKRAAGLWQSFLGADFDLRKLSDRELSAFVAERRAGIIDSHGQRVPSDQRTPVRDRAVSADLEWLRSVLNWGMRARDEAGRYYLSENPMRGFSIPKEKNPRRPVATADRYEQIRRVAGQVQMELPPAGGRRRFVPSYLPEILDVVNGTGRRIRAVLQLRYEDLRLSDGPHGAIRWPADSDKMGVEWSAPINAHVRAALDRVLRDRPGIGRGWLFPSPRSPLRPVSKELASTWLRKAEELAELEPLDGSLWHAYRRKWATERKHLPVQDVARAGGWQDVQVLQAAYQQPDTATLYRVVSEPAELREVKHG